MLDAQPHRAVGQVDEVPFVGEEFLAGLSPRIVVAVALKLGKVATAFLIMFWKELTSRSVTTPA